MFDFFQNGFFARQSPRAVISTITIKGENLDANVSAMLVASLKEKIESIGHQISNEAREATEAAASARRYLDWSQEQSGKKVEAEQNIRALSAQRDALVQHLHSLKGG